MATQWLQYGQLRLGRDWPSGKIYAEEFPEQILLTDELRWAWKRDGSPAVRVDGDRLFITCTNGEAEYLLGDYHIDYCCTALHRLYCRIDN